MEDGALGVGEEAGFVRPGGEEEEYREGEEERWEAFDEEEDSPGGDTGFDVRDAESYHWGEPSFESVSACVREWATDVRPPKAPLSVPAPIKSASLLESSSFLYQRE